MMVRSGVMNVPVKASGIFAPPAGSVASSSVHSRSTMLMPPICVVVLTSTPWSSTSSVLLMPGAELTVVVQVVASISRPSTVTLVFSRTIRVEVTGVSPLSGSMVVYEISLAPLLNRWTAKRSAAAGVSQSPLGLATLRSDRCWP